ncbi:something about silencing, SAS, complex subunit 4-domain-containing protein [Sordaria brevicollis]|uniref:Something about silencing, SAS, complex subunit 4-domain-containing protein n=1 Tax=Sordaria brevicollis TaxID=83679 RepID=A0AAE0U2V9_SORBR|nr:something about silencing, SAS, complex subunit 4-domain-containing protein [Sordaria brevicollis]
MATSTSVTRSRRAEGLRHPHSTNTVTYRSHSSPQNHHAAAAAHTTQPQHNPLASPSPVKHAQQNRNKRLIDSASRECDPAPPPKKARYEFAVEIPARPSFRQSTSIESRDAKPPTPAPNSKPVVTIATAPKPPNPSRVAPPTTAAAKTGTSAVTKQPSGLTRHQEKVVNGLKHELSRLNPNAADTIKEGGRKLRSQEGTRFKSELAAYFPDYDEVIGNDPKEHHLLNIDTPIVIGSTDAVVTHESTSAATPAQPGGFRPRPIESYPIRGYGDALFTDLYDSQTINFSFLETTPRPGKVVLKDDPLPDSLYETAHKKAERGERSFRNTEKGRAQHEKDQIIRLLDALRGHDWLRVMGVSGITEGRKKQFEPAREHFIKGCEAILEKFRRWAAEEKRRKRKKDRANHAESGGKGGKGGKVNKPHGGGKNGKRKHEDAKQKVELGGHRKEEDPAKNRFIIDSDVEMEDQEEETGESDGDPPDESDVDASIAKQLREEAIAAAKKKPSKKGKRPAPPPPPEPEPKLYKEFTSFFKKSYQRDAALNKNRRRGRNVLAWGQPVPDGEEQEFALPQDILDEETLKAHARRKRRDKRSKH